MNTSRETSVTREDSNKPLKIHLQHPTAHPPKLDSNTDGMPQKAKMSLSGVNNSRREVAGTEN